MRNSVLSNQLYILKFYAICCVALAHSCFDKVPCNSWVFALSKISALGVFIFFILSGYFFHIKENFWKKKINLLFLPWLLNALIMYGYSCWHNAYSFTAKGFINYFVGNGTYLWFLTTLVLCYAFCYFYKKFPKLLISFIILNFVSIFLTVYGILPNNISPKKWFFAYINPYLNIFNWLGFFAFGILLQNGGLEKWMYLSKKYFLIILAAYIGLIYLAYHFDYGFIYWTYFTIPQILLGVSVFFALCQSKVTQWRGISSVLIKAGAATLSLYLYHMMIIGKIFVSAPFLQQSMILSILRPVICVLLLWAVLSAGYFISKKIKFNKIYVLLLGFPKY